MAPFTLENRSGWDTSDLRRFFAKGYAAAVAGWGARRSRKRLHIVVTSAPGRTRGCAEVGGNKMVMAIGSPSRFRLRRLARVYEHELAHIWGSPHAHMMPRLLYSFGKTPWWAETSRFGYRGRAPDQLPLLAKLDTRAARSRTKGR